MRYSVAVNKKFRYIKVYTVLKKVNESTNIFSRMVASLVNRFILKKQ